MTYHDHHFHPMGYVSMVTGLDLNDARDFSDVAKRTTKHAERLDGAVVGQRLNDEGLAEGVLPTRELLDSISTDRPVLLYRYCGHIGIANTTALELAGISAKTPDPLGGSFDRHADGTPTGVLRETGLQAVSDVLSPLVIGPSRGTILEALSQLVDLGIGSVTGMVSAGEPMWCGSGHELDTILDLAPDLPIDIDLIVITDTEEELVGAAERIRKTEGRVRFAGWKEFADGSLGGHTAAMYDPYADMPDETGTLRLQHDQAVSMAKTSLNLGGGVAIHAIGDRANDAVVDLFAELVDDGADPTRLRLEHASLLTDPTIDQISKLGITVSVQPAFMASEGSWLEKRLGSERMNLVYRLRSLSEAGVRLLGGSDCPVEPPDPRIGIQAAVGRHGLNPEEALTQELAENLFTPPQSEIQE